MPHITVKMFPGRNPEQKQALTDRMVQAVQDVLGSATKDISVSIVEIDPEEWDEMVAGPDIDRTPGEVTKMPGRSDT